MREKKKKLFCWTIIFVERQANKQFQHSSKRIQGVGERREKRKKKQKPLRKAKQNLKIYLDNILNNLCDSTPRQIFLTAA